MSKKTVSSVYLRKKLVATFKQEACCEGDTAFKIQWHEPNDLGVKKTQRKIMRGCLADDNRRSKVEG